MKPAAVGFRVHSGWTAVVAAAIDEGIPLVLARERAHLVRTFTYEYRQPYHTAATMPADDREVFVSRVRAEARHLAFRTIRRLKSTLDQEGYCLTSSGLLLASGRPLPELAAVFCARRYGREIFSTPRLAPWVSGPVICRAESTNWDVCSARLGPRMKNPHLWSPGLPPPRPDRALEP